MEKKPKAKAQKTFEGSRMGYRRVNEDSNRNCIAKNCGNMGVDLEYRIFEGKFDYGWSSLEVAAKK